MSLEDLYQDVILEHYRSPRHKGRLARPTVSQRGDNPLCGDELELDLAVEDGRIRQVGFEARGCSISVASASMMASLVLGRTLGEAEGLVARFKAMLREGREDPELGDAQALVGVHRFPVRVKCATLAWTTLEAATAALEEAAGRGGPAEG
ncbi:MAG: SUF system NifU family Fe-S cluster assembly protein [Clostridia bacterium]|nr:SUF system NifU family Fe-S cluster assembly protein [Clostridia bacterium]